MKVLSLLLLFGYCLIGFSPIRQRTEKDFDIFVAPKSVQIRDRELTATFSFITIFEDSCSINDAYGSCSASCGVGKAVCKNGHQGLGDRNVFTGAAVPKYYPPTCRCAGSGVGAESCSITDSYGSCGVRGEKGKAVCNPGKTVMSGTNMAGLPSEIKYFPPTCRFIGQATGTESCSIRDRYGSCSRTCDKRRAICKPGETVVLEVNMYGLPKRTKDIPPSCQCGPVSRGE